jgi:prolyl-tRNA synthetase
LIDARDLRSGEKSWGWIKKGIPLRLEVGLREIESGTLSIARRDKGHKEKVPFVEDQLISLLEDIQSNLLAKATQFRDQHTLEIKDKKEFYEFFTAKKDEMHGGFALCHWNQDPAIEEVLKNDLNVTVRCIPLHLPPKAGKCVFSGDDTSCRAIFAKAY